MAREEISLKLGLDAKGFQRGITSIKSQVNDLATEKWSAFKKALSIGAAVEGVRRLGEAMLELRRRSEDIGASTDFLQSFDMMAVKFGGSAETANNALLKLTETIGQARTEGGAAEEKFKRFGIALYDVNGQSRTTEEVFKAIADAYKNSSDAATKAALAFEFFGKTGRDVNNILGEGSAGIDAYTEKMKSLGLVASAANVNAVADAWNNLKANIAGASATLTGSLIRFLSLPFSFSGALSGGAGISGALDIADELSSGSGQTERGNEAQDRARREADELEKIEDINQRIAKVRRDAAATTEDETIANLRLEVDLARDAMQAEDERVKRAEKLLKLEEAKAKLGEAERKRDVEAAKAKDREREAEVQDHIAKMDRLAELMGQQRDQRQQAVESRFRFSLQELAEANPNQFRGNVRRDIFGAREVQRLEQQARWQNLFGTEAERDRLQAMADERRQQIGLLRSDEKYQFRELEKSGSESAEALKTLTRYAKENGIPVKPVMGR